MLSSTNLPLTTSAVLTSQTPPQPQPPTNLPTNQPNITKRVLIFVLVLALLAGVGIVALITVRLIINKPQLSEEIAPTPTPTVAQVKLTKTHRWLNLNDVRQVIEDGNKLYLAVMGGVVVVDKDTGRVLDQITMVDGMRNYTATSMVKKANTLYVGTQDGFSIVDLATRQIKNISVQEGLVNGANILLREDGDNLWVATFRGVSVYNTKTGELKNYQAEFDNGSVPFNAVDLVVTPANVFAINAAGGNAFTLVSQFDKKTSKWTNYKMSDFGVDYVSLFNLTYASGQIWVTDHKHIWHKGMDTSAKWAEDPKLVSLIAANGLKDPIKLVGGDEKELYLLSNDILWGYAVGDSMANIYPVKLNTEGEDIFSGGQLIDRETADQKWWLKPRNNFLGYFDLKSKSTKVIELVGRAMQSGTVLAVIDHKPLVQTDQGVWQYDPAIDSFKKLLTGQNNLDLTLSRVAPIEGTNQILVYSQICGQGCEAPKVFTYDYLENSVKNIEIDSQLVKLIRFEGLGQSYAEFHFDGVNGHVASFSADYKTPLTASLDLDAGTWTVTKVKTASASVPGQIRDLTCNTTYTFVESGNKFKEIAPCEKNIQWSYDTDNGKTRFYVYRNGQKEEMYPPLAPAEYSPFSSGQGIYNVYQVSKLDNELWVGTDRGLAIFNLTTNKWRSIDHEEGLTSNKIGSFIVDGDVLWNSETWSGLMGVILR